jgi:hypothetical protein
MSDVVYYNISINATSPDTAGLTHGDNAAPTKTSIIANNSNPILQNPQDYYGAIVRFSVPCFTIPLIQFLVQTPVLDINKGIYSFTLSYNGIYSSQHYYEYTTHILDSPVPLTGTLLQDFSTYYYFLYSYIYWIDFQNAALLAAFNDLKALSGGALDSANAPYFNYESTTQLISLYADPLYFDQTKPNPVRIYFNTVSQQYFNGFPFNELTVGSVNGADAFLLLKNNNSMNLNIINEKNHE